MDSFGSESEAKKVSAEVSLDQHKGGFHLRNLRSNSECVTATLGESAKVDSKNLYLGPGEHVDRILGMLWPSRTDGLNFFTSMHGTLPTKRQVLWYVMSLCDPLALLSFLIVHGKELMASRYGVGRSSR